VQQQRQQHALDERERANPKPAHFFKFAVIVGPAFKYTAECEVFGD
jgi:hypothetical protein